jgi:hypothetical protein
MTRRFFLPTLGAGLCAAGEQETPLFDGRTLAGWSIQNGSDADYRVREGWVECAPGASPHAWLRSDRQYENFDFQCEFYIEKWMEGGVYLHAPEHGRNTWVGMQVKIFRAPELASNSIGAIFPILQPLKAVVKNQGDWNQMRIRMDWPRLQVWINGEPVQDLDVESVAELRHRFRSGYIGLTGLSTSLRFRGMRIRELASRVRWETLFAGEPDLARWTTVPEKPGGRVEFNAHGDVLRSVGLGNLVTREKYRDFELQAYVRSQANCNGGIFFRTDGKGLAARHYEVQLFNVPDAHFITGSLYGYHRGTYPHVEDEQWYPIQIRVHGAHCLVRVNGDTVTDYRELTNLEEGHIELQSHRTDRWTEYKRILIRRI